MSIKILSRVWDESQASGSALLMLLAIADFADDNGKAYPSKTTLAHKSRMSPRSVQRIIADLEQSGELRVAKQAGPGAVNLYWVIPDGRGGANLSLSQSDLGESPATEGGVTADQKGSHPRLPEPSLTATEPSDIPDGAELYNNPLAPGGQIIITKGDQTEEPLPVEDDIFRRTPDWWGDLKGITKAEKPLVKNLDDCIIWLAEKNISEGKADETAAALAAQWPGKAKYKDVWAAFRNWVQRPALATASGFNGGRATRPEPRTNPEDFKGDWSTT